MPKYHLYPNADPGDADAVDRLELHWQRDGGVQIATTRWAGEGNPDPTLEYLPGTGVNGPAPAWAGQHLEVSRSQINHLIQRLRAARDQAFGRDA